MFNTCNYGIIMFNTCNYGIIMFNACNYGIIMFNTCNYGIIMFNTCIYGIIIIALGRMRLQSCCDYGLRDVIKTNTIFFICYILLSLCMPLVFSNLMSRGPTTIVERKKVLKEGYSPESCCL